MGALFRLLNIVSTIRGGNQDQEAERALEEAHHLLEQRVETRTRDLAQTNVILRREVEERTQAEAALLKSEQQLRMLTSQILSAAEAERQRIARDLRFKPKMVGDC